MVGPRPAGRGPSGVDGAARGNPDPPRIPEQAPAFVLPDLQGRPVALESFRGHPLLVNFWGIWCLPCRAELPELERLAAECSGCLAVVGVTLGSGSASDIGAFAAAHAIRYPLLIGDARIMADYHVDSRRQFFGSSPESCVDGCQDLRSRRANGVRRIGVRPAHHALLADEEQRGYGDDVVLLARAALKVHANLRNISSCSPSTLLTTWNASMSARSPSLRIRKGIE